MNSKSPNQPQNSINLKVDSSIEVVNEIKEVRELMKPFTVTEVGNRKIEKEFSLLNKITSREPNTERLAKGKLNQNLNRYSDVLPYIDNIVKLGPEEELTPQNYINANFIHNPFLEGDLNNFIATQGPLKRTVNHFWKMVEKYQIKVIIAIVEKMAMDSKCYQYWPLSETLETDEYTVSIIKSDETDFIHHRSILLRNKLTNASQSIEHYHIVNWIDHAELKNADFDDFIKLLNDLVTIENSSNRPPIVVHCSAGIGRTGSFICSFFLYWQWKIAKQTGSEFRFSIFSLVRHIREQRFGAVQTVQQYKFLHDIVGQF
jgi:protein tyrosine phosphatase